MKPLKALSAREVYQQLRDAALGLRPVRQLDSKLHSEVRRIDIEGWQLTLEMTGQRPNHCQHCRCPEGREGSSDDWQRTDPINLLSAWEQRQIEDLLGAAQTAAEHAATLTATVASKHRIPSGR